MDFTAVLRAHAQKYPEARVQDYVKLAYQHALGCEHMIGDAQSALARVEEERAGETGARFEEIGNGLCRLHIDGGDIRLSSRAVAGMFAHTARAFKPAPNALEAALSALSRCARSGLLPITGEETEQFLRAYEGEGRHAVRHTEAYRRAYAPAYRVTLSAFSRYARLFEALEALENAKPGAIVAIDGMCASGKTSLAALIGGAMGATVFHMDDFFLPPEMRTQERLSEIGGNVDRERFKREVLRPLKAGKAFQYRPFDCASMSLKPPVSAHPEKLNIVEGAYACHPDLIGYYDRIVFMEIDETAQKTRIRARNGENMLRRFVNEWIPMENRYLTHFQIRARADTIFRAE